MAEDRISSDPDHSDLEKNLGRLSPRGLEGACLSRLSRRMELLEAERKHQRALWVRFAPVAGVSLAAMALALWVQSQLRQPIANHQGDSAAITADPPADPPAHAAPIPAVQSADRTLTSSAEFLPVSYQNYLKRAQDAGIIDTGTPIPAQRLRLEFEDAWHWHDPETQTNIRVFRPREEFILVPVETD